MTTILFYILGFIMLAATLMCITRRNPVHAVIYLVAGFFALALMFYLLGAPLVAAWEIIVYAGAIMVLVLFVIMLLNLQDEERVKGRGFVQRWLGLILAAVFSGKAAGETLTFADLVGRMTDMERLALLPDAGQHQQARAALSQAIEMYRTMDMPFWLSQTEAALAHLSHGNCDGSESQLENP